VLRVACGPIWRCSSRLVLLAQGCELKSGSGILSEKAYFSVVSTQTSNPPPSSPDRINSDWFLNRLLKQEPAAYEELYDHFASAIYGAVLRMLKQEALAEDVLQETFVRVFQKIHMYDRIRGRLFTWILNIAKNRARDVLRSKEYKMGALAVQTDTTQLENEGPRTETPVDQIGLVEVLNTLPSAQKEVVVLLYLQGYTQKEAAEHLDIPLGTVKSRLRLGMNGLRQRMLEAKGGMSG